jgi:NAD(P)-dependent dehydrogenase (short-subunit alcohol dehydrogenase family)
MDDHASLTTAAKKTAELAGGVVDYLIVNGAYFAIPCLLNTADDYVGQEDLFLEELKQSMNTNVAGTLFAFNAFMPLVLKSSIKRVSAISSAAADTQYIVEAEDPLSLHYALSKAALNTLVAKFAARYKHEGVLFVSISPGWVNTHADMPKDLMDKMSAPFYRWDKTLKGPIPPPQSVEMCLNVMDGLQKEQNGEFLSQHGNRVWLDKR